MVPFGDQGARFADGQARDQLLVLVQHAFDIGQQDQAFGLDRARHRARHRVGVDVVGLALGAHADGRDHRNDLRLHDGVQHFRIDLVRLADKAQILDGRSCR